MGAQNKQIGIVPFFAFYVAAALFILPWHHALQSQQDEPPAIDPARIADYDIVVSLDPEKKIISGSETITWTNAGDDVANELKLHLYMNAFKSPDTHFFEQNNWWSDYWTEEAAGWIDVDSLALVDGTNLQTNAVIDETVMTVRLPQEVAPGEVVRLEVGFTVHLPKIISRSGYSDNYFFVAQWFPKIGVFRDGKWLCPQYHSFSEYFSDFGQYRVEITVPKEYEVAATGIRERARTDATTKTLVYSAHPVHDFAWMASPDYRRTRRELEYSVDGESPGKLEVHYLLHKDKQFLLPQYEISIKTVLEHFSRLYGPFPYPKLVVVDPPYGQGIFSGGMEYPMLITGGQEWLYSVVMPGDEYIKEITTHEFAHQYWYAAVATNEFDEAWLDEGLTTFTSYKVFDTFGRMNLNNDLVHILGDTIATLHPFRRNFKFSYYSFVDLLNHGIERNSLAYSRREYLLEAGKDPVSSRSYQQYDFQTYSNSAYYKPDIMFRTLERMIGEDILHQALRRYYTEFRFRHPTGVELRAILSEAAGRDLEWFFSQVLDGSGTVDYAITSVESDEVLCERNGEVLLPQTIALTFSDGEVINFEWNPLDDQERVWMDHFIAHESSQDVKYRLREGAQQRWLRIEISSRREIISAQVDPEYKYLLDINFANNSLKLESNPQLADRVSLGWIRVLGRWLHGISAYN